ncbi:hypothetical protein POTOM_005092 [Populus tomentosa]|uniref:Glutamate/phenylalanine/leucine/valine/L-tryptophan dehydrogenase C-terminal domain-containing protein n=1 Tax=Populus tomentosa TaxID=118781 RepID=A0A8X8ALA2_POPTO|nr:hypothetical protein POTOM_005092 [Populus tomentosa]
MRYSSWKETYLCLFHIHARLMQGSFTGPRVFWSGSSLRTEATGYGLVFFVQLMLAGMNKEIKGLRCAVSGSGKITMHVLEKLIAYGALPIAYQVHLVVHSKGYLVDEDGFDYMKISFLRETTQRLMLDPSTIKTYARSKYYDEAKPWSERGDVAFPCGYQNEIHQSDAINLVNSGCRILVQGSNETDVPKSPESSKQILANKRRVPIFNQLDKWKMLLYMYLAAQEKDVLLRPSELHLKQQKRTDPCCLSAIANLYLQYRFPFTGMKPLCAGARE